MIIDFLLSQDEARRFRTADTWRERNINHVVLGALDAASIASISCAINAPPVPYLVKQAERTASAMSWIENELIGEFLTASKPLG